jgi:hypothetical protein
VSAPELTETTIRYLFATGWLPRAIDTAGNLLHIAMWNLRGRGPMEFEELRPVERGPACVLAGKPFSGHGPIDPHNPGLGG